MARKKNTSPAAKPPAAAATATPAVTWTATWTPVTDATSASAKDPGSSADAIRQIYHFSLGDSTRGAVGYCAQIVATSEAEAVARLRRAIAGVWQGIGMDDLLVADPPYGARDRREYLRFYVNAEAISAGDIDEHMPEDCYD